ncbi:MAG: hypothetical protein IPK72_21385 [Candidatus Eisenbacteria bacterium]|nr:hypothetical protein [Candidatus Eisenbacteria bacterium]
MTPSTATAPRARLVHVVPDPPTYLLQRAGTTFGTDQDREEPRPKVDAAVAADVTARYLDAKARYELEENLRMASIQRAYAIDGKLSAMAGFPLLSELHEPDQVVMSEFSGAWSEYHRLFPSPAPKQWSARVEASWGCGLYLVAETFEGIGENSAEWSKFYVASPTGGRHLFGEGTPIANVEGASLSTRGFWARKGRVNVTRPAEVIIQSSFSRAGGAMSFGLFVWTPEHQLQLLAEEGHPLPGAEEWTFMGCLSLEFVGEHESLVALDSRGPKGPSRRSFIMNNGRFKASEEDAIWVAKRSVPSTARSLASRYEAAILTRENEVRFGRRRSPQAVLSFPIKGGPTLQDRTMSHANRVACSDAGHLAVLANVELPKPKNGGYQPRPDSAWAIWLSAPDGTGSVIATREDLEKHDRALGSRRVTAEDLAVTWQGHVYFTAAQSVWGSDGRTLTPVVMQGDSVSVAEQGEGRVVEAKFLNDGVGRDGTLLLKLVLEKPDKSRFHAVASYTLSTPKDHKDADGTANR